VRRYELINEPNALDSSSTFTNPPDTMAALLADLWMSVKVQHPNDSCWNVQLISGGLAGAPSMEGGCGVSLRLDSESGVGALPLVALGFAMRRSRRRTGTRPCSARYE